ncbi:MAG: DUF1857 family protein [Planctomycetes bacterium]|nr:DUF1857 family protein [Planctomycetota bacterium]
MFTLTRTIPVNPPGAEVVLDRQALWESLVLKAEDPLPFVPAIRSCRVLERLPDGLVREIEARGQRLRERVTFHAPTRVHFLRIAGPTRGEVENVIEAGPDGALSLRFSFRLEADGLPHGSPEERAHAAEVGASYLAAVDATLRVARRRMRGEPLGVAATVG